MNQHANFHYSFGGQQRDVFFQNKEERLVRQRQAHGISPNARGRTPRLSPVAAGAGAADRLAPRPQQWNNHATHAPNQPPAGADRMPSFHGQAHPSYPFANHVQGPVNTQPQPGNFHRSQPFAHVNQQPQQVPQHQNYSTHPGMHQHVQHQQNQQSRQPLYQAPNFGPVPQQQPGHHGPMMIHRSGHHQQGGAQLPPPQQQRVPLPQMHGRSTHPVAHPPVVHQAPSHHGVGNVHAQYAQPHGPGRDDRTQLANFGRSLFAAGPQAQRPVQHLHRQPPPHPHPHPPFAAQQAAVQPSVHALPFKAGVAGRNDHGNNAGRQPYVGVTKSFAQQPHHKAVRSDDYFQHTTQRLGFGGGVTSLSEPVYKSSHRHPRTNPRPEAKRYQDSLMQAEDEQMRRQQYMAAKAGALRRDHEIRNQRKSYLDSFKLRPVAHLANAARDAAYSNAVGNSVFKPV